MDVMELDNSGELQRSGLTISSISPVVCNSSPSLCRQKVVYAGDADEFSALVDTKSPEIVALLKEVVGDVVEVLGVQIHALSDNVAWLDIQFMINLENPRLQANVSAIIKTVLEHT